MFGELKKWLRHKNIMHLRCPDCKAKMFYGEPVTNEQLRMFPQFDYANCTIPFPMYFCHVCTHTVVADQIDTIIMLANKTRYL